MKAPGPRGDREWPHVASEPVPLLIPLHCTPPYPPPRPLQYGTRFKDTGGSRDTHETHKNLTNQQYPVLYSTVLYRNSPRCLFTGTVDTWPKCPHDL